METPAPTPVISVCIATFRRPDQLRRLLTALLQNVRYPVPAEILVCENDATLGAKSIVAEAAALAAIPMRYLIEPIQNISRVRNRLVRDARGQWIAFIDDDEIPCRQWLTELWAVASSQPTVIAKGPVRRVFPLSAPRWLAGLPYPGATLPAAGSPLSPGRLSGGNILVRRDLLTELSGVDGPFDLKFGLRGGEDILTYGRLALRYPDAVRAAPGAIVEEFWDDSRSHSSWLLRRAFRSGQLWCDIEALLYGGHRRWVRVPLAALRCVLRLPFLPAVLLLPSSKRIEWLIRLAGLLGQVSAVFPARDHGYIASAVQPIAPSSMESTDLTFVGPSEANRLPDASIVRGANS